MNAIPMTLPQPGFNRELPSRGRVGMFSLIAAESAIFTIFVVAYLFYIGKSLTGPMPNEVLRAPVFYTVCLLSSSLTIHWPQECSFGKDPKSCPGGVSCSWN